MIPIRYILVIAIPAGCLGAGFHWGRSSVEITTVTQYIDRVVTVQKQADTQIEYRDRIVTVDHIVHVDGTVEDKTVTEEQAQDTHQIEKETINARTTERTQTTQTATAGTGSLSRYSLGLSYQSRLADFPTEYRDWISYRLEAGIRVLASPIWLTAGAVGTGEVSIGIRYEFR